MGGLFVWLHGDYVICPSGKSEKLLCNGLAWRGMFISFYFLNARCSFSCLHALHFTFLNAVAISITLDWQALFWTCLPLFFLAIRMSSIDFIQMWIVRFINRASLPTVCSQLVSMIASLEHMADITAQLAKVLFDRCGGHSDLVTEIVKDISRENFSENSKTTNAVRNLSHFIVCFFSRKLSAIAHM